MYVCVYIYIYIYTYVSLLRLPDSKLPGNSTMISSTQLKHNPYIMITMISITYVYIYIYIYRYTHIHIYICIYIYMYTCIDIQKSWRAAQVLEPARRHEFRV